MKQLICPISNERTDERLTRASAFFTILIMAAGIILNSLLFILFLLVDFYLRAFGKSKFSPVNLTSAGVLNLLQMDKKPIDKAPKVFAARMGFVMTLLAFILMISGLLISAKIVGGILIFFASLELLFGICVGCYIYSYLVLPFFRK